MTLNEYAPIVSAVPEPVNKRSYISPARQAKAEATRARIIDAAARLFLEAGYERTTTGAIGKMAGTSEASVFAAFGSKASLLVSVVAAQVQRHPDFPLRAQPIWQQFARQPDKTTAIEEFARVVCRAHARSWRLLAVAGAAAEGDPVVARAVAAAAGRRHADVGWLLREVIGVPGPRLDRTTDEIWTLISVENYRHLVIERSWPPGQYESWLAAMLSATLR